MPPGLQPPSGTTQVHDRTVVVTEGFPTRLPLAMPIDVTVQEAQEVRAVTEVLNPPVADFFALYVKARNFRGHLSGAHVCDYHLLFDE